MDDLFSFAQSLETAPTPSEPPEPQILTVTELTRSVRELLEGEIGTVWVAGEIGNYRKQASGHQYFTLKDDRCQLSCVLFHRPYQRQKHPALSEGMQVQVRGQLTVYETRGQYQLNVNLVQAAGTGLLAARFEALKQKLEAEGLFAAPRKKALPRLPQIIGLVTSPTGAALRDMLHVLARRAPWVRIVVSPTRVQGAGAHLEIIAALQALSAGGKIPRPDAIIVGRGGGSLEDLWEFNEEALARALAACEIPVVSAVGHEIDFTIADFVADVRAPTPSAAAELVVADLADLQERIRRGKLDLARPLLDLIRESRHSLRLVAGHELFRQPARIVQDLQQEIDDLHRGLDLCVQDTLRGLNQSLLTFSAVLRERNPAQLAVQKRQQLGSANGLLRRQVRRAFEIERDRLAHARKILAVLAPEATLERGFSITQTEDGHLITGPDEVKTGQKLVTRLRGGRIRSTVDKR